MEEKNKKIETKNIEIKNKDKKITNLKIKMWDMDNQIVEKDLVINQVEVALQASKEKAHEV